MPIYKTYTCQTCHKSFSCNVDAKYCVYCGATLPVQLPREKDDTIGRHYLLVMRDYLVENSLINIDTSLETRVRERNAGKRFSLQDHVRGLIYAQLTNQTVWSRILPHLNEIDRLFYHYDIGQIQDTPWEQLAAGLFRLKCGNISTEAQMKYLSENIRTLQRIDADYGHIDSFVTSAPAYKIVKMLSESSSSYKLKMVGPALAWEYLRNVGVDGAKPDTHTRRFLGQARMGSDAHLIATPEEVYNQVERLSIETGLSRTAIDNIIWSYCANGFGAICTSSPKCQMCKIREFCHYLTPTI